MDHEFYEFYESHETRNTGHTQADLFSFTAIDPEG